MPRWIRPFWVLAILFASTICVPHAWAAYGGPNTYAVPCSTCFSAQVAVTGTTSTALSPVPGSGLYAYVTHFSCFNTGASNTTVILQNGSGGTTLWTGNVPATTGGFVATFPTPLGGDTALGGGMTVATAVYFKAGTATTSLTCDISGYMAP